MPTPLLMTKLYLPVPGKYLVERPRLVEKLDRCLEAGCRLGLVSAGAGFGKTTLLAGWAASAKARQPHLAAAWLSLDAGDNDPVIFWSYAIAAIQLHQTQVGEKALTLLAAYSTAQSTGLESALASLINDLSQVGCPVLLVCDDYHLIRSQAVHQSLAYFIEHLPRHVHLLLASRTDPPLPLALLRGRGQLVELRLHDLRFSNEDAGAYLNGGIGLNLAAPAVQTLNQKTEGWIAGLQMAALAMQEAARHGEPAAQSGGTAPKQAKLNEFVASFSGSNRYILDYLIEEVLNRQPEAIQSFLARTAILDLLCGPLCDALLAGEPGEHVNSQAVLEQLERSNLFLFPLDDQRRWYRYHQLFADLLRKRLSQTRPAEIDELHRRAAAWYEQNGLVPRAIQHALEMKAYPKAAALVSSITEELWGRGEHATLLAWMDALPDQEKQHHPSLLTFQVSMLISAGKLKEAEACIPVLERYIEASLAAHSPQPALIGSVSTLRTYIASFYGDRPALFSHARSALENLTQNEDAGKRCGVSLVMGSAYLTEGQPQEAAQAFETAIVDARKARKPSMLLSGLANLAVVLYLQGHLQRAAQVCQEGLAMVEQYGFDRSPMTVDLYLAWGEVLRERGELPEAQHYIELGLALSQEQNFVWQAAWGLQARARLRLAQGDLAGAENDAQAAVQWADSHPVPAHIAAEAAALLAEIWLRQGQLAPAEALLQSRLGQPQLPARFPHLSEHLAFARLDWLQGRSRAAQERLAQVLEPAQAQQLTRTVLAACLLQAQASQSINAALPALEKALKYAQEEGYRQIYLAEGSPLAGLLNEAARLSIEPGTANRLLQAFSQQTAGSAPAAPPSTPPAARQTVQPLAEPLSRRELETLRLMAEGCSNKEIALKMNVALRTVKYYSTGLYNKLGVDSRMQAVVRARELGLL